MSELSRRLVGLGIATVVLALGYAATRWHDARLDEQAQLQAQAKRLFAAPTGTSLATSDDWVQHIDLHNRYGHFELRRQGDVDPNAPAASRWHLVQPLQAPADDHSIASLLQACLHLEGQPMPQPTSVPTPMATHDALAVYGLDKPNVSVRLSTLPKAHEQPYHRTLWLGSRNSFDGSLYVRVDSQPHPARVGPQAASIAQQLDVDLMALRDRRLLPIDPTQMVELRVKPDKGTGYVLRRENNAFSVAALSGPDPASLAFVPADPHLAQDIFDALGGVQARSFAEDNQPRRLFGLDTPRYVITVHLAPPGPDYEVRLGQKVLGDKLATFATAAGPVMDIGSDWVFKKLDVPLDTLRKPPDPTPSPTASGGPPALP